MARGRMISKSLSTSEKRASLHRVAGRLAEFAQGLYPLLVVHADDFGRLQGDVFTVKHAVDPTSPRKPLDFALALRALHDVGLIRWYGDDNGGAFIEIVSFDVHQAGLHKRTKSRFPGDSGKLPEIPFQLNLKKGTEQKELRAAAAPRSSPNGNPEAEENYTRILALVHKEILQVTTTRDVGELIDATKNRCAQLHLAYNSSVVRKAVESALHT